VRERTLIAEVQPRRAKNASLVSDLSFYSRKTKCTLALLPGRHIPLGKINSKVCGVLPARAHGVRSVLNCFEAGIESRRASKGRVGPRWANAFGKNRNTTALTNLCNSRAECIC